MKIVIPELNNPLIQLSIKDFPEVRFIEADSLRDASKKVKNGSVDSMLSGLEFSSREVVLACKENLPLASSYFSSCFICKKEQTVLALADGGINKTPTNEQLLTIVEDTARTFQEVTGETPRIAMLSYSTNGSGGQNPDLKKIHFVINKIRQKYPDYVIDGEMQLDVAVVPEVSEKKYPGSTIRGDANILIVPDLNSGNILYKALERFGGFTIAGPIIQGFAVPIVDLSRGSTAEDIRLTLRILIRLLQHRRDPTLM